MFRDGQASLMKLFFVNAKMQGQKVIPLRICIFAFFISSFFSCTSTQLLTKKEKNNLHSQIVDSPIFSKSQTGFALYDPVAKEMLYEQDADILFTPASNTKIFTLYAALKILGDSIPALRYIERGESLVFWGTGDPSLWHPDLPTDNSVELLLADTTKQLFYCPENFMDERYGSGWAWDDYLYSYQVEKSALPVFANSVCIEKDAGTTVTFVTPPYFGNQVNTTPNQLRNSPRFKRDRFQNNLQLQGKIKEDQSFQQTIPFVYSDQILLDILQEKLKRPIELLSTFPSDPTLQKQTIYSISSDSLYQQMMQESDNFLAEQMLLLCANELFDTLNVS